VDKVQEGGFSGDPASALLEVLDPEQNSTFTDHYLDLPYDLSDVFFLATANSLDTIPGPLLDRMEVIQISSYTAEEKFHIGKEHLLAEVLEDTGLTADQLVLEDEALRKIISDYTQEGGVRGLKKQLGTIARVVTQRIVSDGAQEAPFVVTADDLEEMLGRKVAFHDRALTDNPAGVVTGLAWTPVGGEILFIETTDMPGNGEIILTGQLGDVMKESARIAMSLLKSRLPMNAAQYKERDVHIHVPAGSTPKDGPSAGVTLFTALASLFTGKRVDPHLAMTGEISLRGAVLPIGGLKEKLIAADRAGITKVLIPEENRADLKDVPEEVRERLTIVPVETIEDVLHEALDIELPRAEHMMAFGGPNDIPFGGPARSGSAE
ncbi:MAG: endopeptidase La, partial [Clostridia bacterium]|nr:endopeptidase La [Clostridia bacterium]